MPSFFSAQFSFNKKASSGNGSEEAENITNHMENKYNDFGKLFRQVLSERTFGTRAV